MKGGLKLAVLAMFIVIVYRSRFRQWTAAARDHFNFLMAICFFTLMADIVYEAYLTFLLVMLVYAVAIERSLSRQARYDPPG